MSYISLLKDSHKSWIKMFCEKFNQSNSWNWCSEYIIDVDQDTREFAPNLIPLPERTGNSLICITAPLAMEKLLHHMGTVQIRLGLNER